MSVESAGLSLDQIHPLSLRGGAGKAAANTVIYTNVAHTYTTMLEITMTAYLTWHSITLGAPVAADLKREQSIEQKQQISRHKTGTLMIKEAD